MMMNDSTALINGIYQRNNCYPLAYQFNTNCPTTVSTILNNPPTNNSNNNQNDIHIVNNTDFCKHQSEHDLYNHSSKIQNNYNQPDRVTMKIDVSYTDHSHVIGKGGQSIKSIMTETECHIHFPDSNRTNTIEKSNQVSISGLPSGVEMARQKIRAILPLIYSFDNPYVPYNVLEQQDKTLIANLQRMLEVSISYRPMGKVVNGTTIYVKGIVMRYKQTIRAVNVILTHQFGQNIEQIPVMMTIEIDPKHHSFLLNQGRQNSLGSEIFKLTGATINFPDNTFTPAHAALAASNPMGISGLFKKSTVTIWGTAESTFEARQQLIGRLPVILMYDITIEEGVNLEMFNLNSINEAYDVLISIKLKLKQSTKSVIIRTTEQNVQALFEVKNILNKLRQQFKPIIHCGLKTLPQIQLNKINNIVDMKMNQSGIKSTLSNGVSNVTPSQTKLDKPILINGMTKHPITNCSINGSTSSPTYVGSVLDHRPNFIFTPLRTDTPEITMVATAQQFTPISYTSNIGNRAELIMPASNSQGFVAMKNETNQINNTNNNCDLKSISESIDDIITPNSDPIIDSCSGEQSHLSCTAADWRAPGAEYSAKQRELKRSVTDSPIQSLDELTKRCSEMFLVNSENEINKENFPPIKEQNLKRNNCLINGNLMNNGHFDTNHLINDNGINKKFHEITNILHNLCLDRYVDTFIKNEVDLNTLCSLTENDLKEMGVETLGARRKIMMAINDMRNLK